MKRRKLEPIIIETSLQLFKEKSFDEVSVVDICNACDITKPTFYKYASGKGDLLRFYFNRIPENFTDQWDDVEIQGSYWNCVKKGLISFLTHFMSYGLDLCTQLYIENIESYQDTFTLPEMFVQKLADLLKNAQDNHEIYNMEDPAYLVKYAISLMIGYGGYYVLFSGQKDVIKEYSDALDIVMQVRP